jgi:hypothetical protein
MRVYRENCFAYRLRKSGAAECAALKPESARCDGCGFFKTAAELARQGRAVKAIND